jgi:TatD DNase family protein
VVIHTRAADEDTRDRLLAHDGPVVLHCFSSPGLLEPALERGWYVSLAGNVSYKNAYDLRAAVRRVPHDKLLAETDSPYLAPQPVRGKRNEPAYVVHTYDVLAELHGEEIREQIVTNAERLFQL